MSYSRGHTPDATAETAIGDVSAHELLVAVLSRISDDEDRALLFAHVAIDIPLGAIGRQLGATRRELESRIDSILASLRQDSDLIETLTGIRRAGRSEHYQAIIISLGLQDWFCSYCSQFMVQPRTGRPRKTCSSRCRHNLWLDKHATQPIAPMQDTLSQKTALRTPLA